MNPGAFVALATLSFLVACGSSSTPEDDDSSVETCVAPGEACGAEAPCAEGKLCYFEGSVEAARCADACSATADCAPGLACKLPFGVCVSCGEGTGGAGGASGSAGSAGTDAPPGGSAGTTPGAGAGGQEGTPPLGPCERSCRALEDQYALLGCGALASAFLTCLKDQPFVCTQRGQPTPDPRSSACDALSSGISACVDAAADAPAPAEASRAGEGYDGVWAGATDDELRFAFIVRDGLLADLLVFLPVSSSQATCAAPLGLDLSRVVDVSAGSFVAPLVSLSSTVSLDAAVQARVEIRFDSPTRASGTLLGFKPAVIICGGLSIVASSGTGTTELGASYQGPATVGQECAEYCDTVESTSCPAGDVPLGNACTSDADCAGGTCVNLQGLNGIEACWAVDWSTLTCPVSRRSASSFAWAGGYCSPFCVDDADCASPGATGACVLSVSDGYLVRDASLGYLCAADCDAEGACSAGLACTDTSLTCGEAPSSASVGTCVPCP